jgi:hypothetical protein
MEKDRTSATPRRDKRDRFLELAEKRTRVVLKKLQVLGNCGNRQSYEYTPEDVERIFSAIEQQLARVRAKFEQDREKKIDFRLK